MLNAIRQEAVWSVCCFFLADPPQIAAKARFTGAFTPYTVHDQVSLVPVQAPRGFDLRSVCQATTSALPTTHSHLITGERQEVDH